MKDFLKILCALRLPRSLVTRLGRVCVQNKTERKLDSLRAFYYDVPLLTTAYSAYTVHFFLGQFPKYGIDVVVVVAFILFTESLNFCDCVTSVVITQFLTGCLCALNYVSKLDHLIYMLLSHSYQDCPIDFHMLHSELFHNHVLVPQLSHSFWCVTRPFT